MSRLDLRISRRAVIAFTLLGLFILFDLALFGWLIFRSLSEREIERVLLDTREQAEGLADQIADRASTGDRDLFTAVASEQETLSYIDSILQQRDVVQRLEIRDREGLLVYRSVTETTIPAEPGEARAFQESEVQPSFESRTTERENSFDLESSPFDIEVAIGELGFVHVGISQTQLQQRVELLRGDLVRLVAAIGAVTLGLLSAAYLAVWWLYRRGRRLEEQAAEAERMAYIGTLASGLAHEIRNPLNSLRLNIQMLEEDLERDEGLGTDRKILAITRSEIARLERLATDFLSYARPRALELEEVKAVDLLRSAREVLASEIEASGSSVTILDRTEGERVRVDRPQMKQLLINLLQNALAAVASERDAGRIDLVARRRGDSVVLEVHDDGPGIPRLEQGKIFDLFYSTRKGGTGLGLAIVKRIAQAHAADLSVSSAPGKGTTISVSLGIGATGDETRLAGPIVESRAAS
jgi:signal transduction histidine kinase